MKIIISGASGLVGRALTAALRSEGHTVLHLVRRSGHSTEPAREGEVLWDPHSATVDVAALEAADAIAHLNGASIAGGRWTPARKQILRSSRIDTTRILVDSIARLRQKPRVFVAASAVGYYGHRGDEILTESSSVGTGFLALLARDWEAEAIRAQTGAGVRTTILRFGVIFAAEGGALGPMLAPFKFGLGGPLGTGDQWISWVALQDVIAMIRLVIANPEFAGPLNVVSPHPVRNSEFARTAGKILHRPAIFPTPAFLLRLAVGEMAGALLLTSQRVIPERLLSVNFPFQFPDLESTLRAILKK